MKRAFWVLTAGAIGSAAMAVSLSYTPKSSAREETRAQAERAAPSFLASPAKAEETR